MDFVFLTLQFAVLLIPGYVLACLFKLRQHLFLVSLVFSYFYFIVLLSFGRELNVLPTTFAWSYGVILLVMLLFVAKRRNFVLAQNTSHWLPGLMAVIAGYILYFLWAGNYTKVPSDVYQHLLIAQGQLRFWNEGGLGNALPLSDLLQQKGRYWYGLLAGLTYFTDGLLINTFESAMFLNSLFFLVAVYFFAFALFGGLSFSSNQRQLAAVLAVFFVFAHMGINAFSFVRYYALAPVMLNFAAFFAGVLAFLALFQMRQVKSHLIILMVSLLVSAMVHTQEALFIVVMAVLTLAVLLIQQTANKSLTSFYRYGLPLFMLVFIATMILALVWFAANHFAHAPQPAHLIVRIAESVPFFGHLMVLNPAHQLVKVITIWGALVYLLFFLFWRDFKSQPFLIAAMLSPLFTVLNPLFVDLFLRFDSATTLWRLLYLVPLPYVAAIIVVKVGVQFNHQTAIKKIQFTLAVALVFIMLLPQVMGVKINAFAKITLLPVTEKNDYHYWKDVFDYLNQVQGRQKIITDPLTGYMVRALTPHHTYGYKFYERADWMNQFSLLEGDGAKPIRQWLLINRREGDKSLVGQKARHWSAQVLQFKHYYESLDLAQNQLSQHQKIYDKDKVQIWAHE